MTNVKGCTEDVARTMTKQDRQFDPQSEHANFQSINPAATIRLSHGRLHHIAMRNPTDQIDLPGHQTCQMNLAIDRSDSSHYSQGVPGETFVPTRDDDSSKIMHGMGSIRGAEEDCELAHHA